VVKVNPAITMVYIKKSIVSFFSILRYHKYQMNTGKRNINEIFTNTAIENKKIALKYLPKNKK
jgi:hypothetical protein